MDRSRQYRFEPDAAVQCGGTFTVEFLLPAREREPEESRRDAIAGRAVHAAAVLRGSTNDPVAGRPRVLRQFQAGKTITAADGTGSDLSQTALVRPGAGTPDLPVSTARTGDHTSQPGVGYRHHVHPVARWIRISGGGHGLVQPVRAGLGSIDHAGFQLLRVCFGLGAEGGLSGNLQLRSGIAIYKHRVHRPSQRSRHFNQHGRTGTGDGQHLRRAAVADGEVRGSLPKGLPRRVRYHFQSRGLLCFLQWGTSTSIAGGSDPKGSLFFARAKGLWKMTRLMEIRKERGFPQPFAKPCWVSHISHRPDDDGVSSRQFNHGRQRPTLTKSIFCPTNGEHLNRLV